MLSYQDYNCGASIPLAMYDSLFSPMVFRAERSNLRLSSGGIPKRKTARPMTATMPARAVKKVEADILGEWFGWIDRLCRKAAKNSSSQEGVLLCRAVVRQVS